ncbi:MAG: RNA polymerase sigma factor [Mesonia hippocampi]|uniref:RNA polymerase sigma factor n=1 Tax=Mesonia hippocampi TaxID=1628250 RepID=UPI003F94676F
MSNPQQHKHAKLSDEELIRDIVKTRDTNKFATLYNRYAEKVYHKCLSFSKSPEEAQDLVHDIFIKLFVKLSTFNHQSKFSTWLYSFTYNFCVNHVERKLKKHKEKFVSSENLTIYENYNQEISREIHDREIFDLKTEKLQLALLKIDANSKTLLLMKYQDDFSIKEIMDALSLKESAVKMRLNRAKARLIEIYNTI